MVFSIAGTTSPKKTLSKKADHLEKQFKIQLYFQVFFIFDSGFFNRRFSRRPDCDGIGDKSEPDFYRADHVAQAAGARAGRGRGRGSRAWDLSVIILALCVAIIFGYYSVM